MSRFFEVNAKLNPEIIATIDDSNNIFYRWQNPEWDITGPYTESWAQLYSSAEEARACCEEWGMTEEEAVLPGKSCYKTFSEALYSRHGYPDYVLLAFVGQDTYVTGHDGEYVAEYIKPYAIFSSADVYNYSEETCGII